MIEVRNLVKKYGSHMAVNHLNFTIEKGKIYGFLGPNGAGKSTTMNMITGYIASTEGEILIDGHNILEEPEEAKKKIGYLPEIPPLYVDMTVSEYLKFVAELKSIPKEKRSGNINEVMSTTKLQSVKDRLIKNLSKGYRQRVGLAQALLGYPEIIILDEPTAVLTPLEVEQLLQILLEMKKEGKTIIFITHKLKETMAVSDHVTILRSGKSVEFLKTTETTEKELAALMVGYEIDMTLERKKVEKGETILSLQNVRLLPQAEKTVDLEIRAGEILGIAGVEGNGQQQLEEMIMGLEKVKCGKIFFKQEEITGMSVKERCKRGIGYIPSDRYKRAILPGFSLKDNYLLGNQYKDSYARKGMLNQEYIEKKTKELMEKFDVRAVNGDQLIGALSGGNQQKLVLSREVDKDPDLILACQPVRGLDIGAIKFIHNVLLELRNQGKAVLLISAELSDLFQLSDRIGVLYKGEMMSLQETEKYTTESISLLMAGKKGV